MRLGPPERLPVPGTKTQPGCSRDGRVIACPEGWGASVVLSPGTWRGTPQPPTGNSVPHQVRRLSFHEDVRSIAVSPDGRWVATGSHGASSVVKIWEAACGRLVKDLSTGGMSSVAFSPDGKWLAAGAMPFNYGKRAPGCYVTLLKAVPGVTLPSLPTAESWLLRWAPEQFAWFIRKLAQRSPGWKTPIMIELEA
jgi:hypothetical protein